jgi:pilus assembly protein Flp/PilA
VLKGVAALRARNKNQKRRTSMKKVSNFVKAFLKEEEGASAVEYGVLVALIIAGAIVAIGYVGEKVDTAFRDVDTAMGGQSG